MAGSPETIDIFSARPGDIVIYGGYINSESLRDECFVGIYQSFEYWTPDERPLKLWVQMIGRNKDDLDTKIFIRANQVIHIYKGNERTREHGNL
jgi:hypothetical protein